MCWPRRTSPLRSGFSTDMARRSVLIFLPDMFSARNFLFTPLWEELRRRKDADIVMVTPSAFHRHAIEESGAENISWARLGDTDASIRSAARRALRSPSSLRRLFRLLALRISANVGRDLHARIICRFNSVQAFATHRLKRDLPRREKLKQYGEIGSLAWPFPKSRRLFQWMYRIATLQCWPVPEWAVNLFRSRSPDLAVVAYPQTYQGFAIARTAKRLDVSLLAYINSWDQPTTKGPLPTGFAGIMVWNQRMKDELIRFHGVPETAVSAVGAPHHDLYRREDVRDSREVFLRSLSLPTEAEILLYGTYNRRLGADEPAIARHVAQRVSEGAFGQRVILLIRPHPKDREWRERFGTLDSIDRVQVLPSSQYGTSSEETPDRPDKDMRFLINLLAHSDVVLNGPGTLALDAVAFDKPTVNIGFDGDRSLRYEHSIRFRYDFDHYAPVIETGGTWLVESYDELDAAVRAYLADPTRHAEGRQRLRDQYLEPLDGRASARIADAIFGTALGEEGEAT